MALCSVCYIPRCSKICHKGAACRWMWLRHRAQSLRSVLPMHKTSVRLSALIRPSWIQSWHNPSWTWKPSHRCWRASSAYVKGSVDLCRSANQFDAVLAAWPCRCASSAHCTVCCEIQIWFAPKTVSGELGEQMSQQFGSRKMQPICACRHVALAHLQVLRVCNALLQHDCFIACRSDASKQDELLSLWHAAQFLPVKAVYFIWRQCSPYINAMAEVSRLDTTEAADLYTWTWFLWCNAQAQVASDTLVPCAERW